MGPKGRTPSPFASSWGFLEECMSTFWEPLPTFPEGFKYILVVVDAYSKFCEAIPLKTQRAKKVADACYSVFCRWGALTCILSDLNRKKLFPRSWRFCVKP